MSTREVNKKKMIVKRGSKDSPHDSTREEEDNRNMEDLTERIKQLLGQGLPGTVVATAVGCEASYISQLMEGEEFKTAVLTLKATKAEGAVKRDNKWNEVEDIALDRALELVHLVQRPNDLLRIAAVANSAKRRSTEFANASESAAPTVNLTFPAAAVIHFQMNSDSQVVEVDGRSMQALPTKKLAERLAERQIGRDSAGVVTVPMPTLGPRIDAVQQTERKKVVSILEQIGYADEPVPVQKVLA